MATKIRPKNGKFQIWISPEQWNEIQGLYDMRLNFSMPNYEAEIIKNNYQRIEKQIELQKNE